MFLFWRGSRVMVLKGSKAKAFLLRIADQDDAEQQMVMARITGNFKRGNERPG